VSWGTRAALVWTCVLAAILVPLAIAASSPLLAWRQPVYIVAGLAGVVALGLMLCQPLLAGGALPGLGGRRGRRVHRVIGVALLAAVGVHVAGLWVTSPPDVVDALLFTSATPFSAWGVIAMWALFAAAGVAVLRRRMRPRAWRLAHSGAVSVVVVTGTVHAMLIEGTMGPWSKAALCVLVLAATAKVLVELRVWRTLPAFRRSG
jgi:predicted ferric reductase